MVKRHPAEDSGTPGGHARERLAEFQFLRAAGTLQPAADGEQASDADDKEAADGLPSDRSDDSDTGPPDDSGADHDTDADASRQGRAPRDDLGTGCADSQPRSET